MIAVVGRIGFDLRPQVRAGVQEVRRRMWARSRQKCRISLLMVFVIGCSFSLVCPDDRDGRLAQVDLLDGKAGAERRCAAGAGAELPALLLSVVPVGFICPHRLLLLKLHQQRATVDGCSANLDRLGEAPTLGAGQGLRAPDAAGRVSNPARVGAVPLIERLDRAIAAAPGYRPAGEIRERGYRPIGPPFSRSTS